MKYLGKCSGKLYSEEESENMPECGIRVNDSADPGWLEELHEEAADEWDKAMTEMRKLSLMCCGSYEIEYQQKHKKVKDRYSSTKFYANNFKRNKRRKK